MADYTSSHSGSVMDAAITKAVKLPAIASGDANKSLKVKADETGHEHVDEYSDAEIDALIAATYTDAEVDTLLNAKAPIANPTFTGEIGIGSINVSETELGTLEGITPSTAELNYVNGVTSAIQTQFSGKLDKFPTGTAMLFQQSAAPTGWTVKNSWASSHSLVIVNAANYSDGIAGSDSPTSWTTNVQVAAHATHTHNMNSHTHNGPSHTHNMNSHTHNGPSHNHRWYNYTSGANATTYNSAGSGIQFGGATSSYIGFLETGTINNKPTVDGWTANEGTAESGAPSTASTVAGGTAESGAPSTSNTEGPSTASAYNHVEEQCTYVPRYQHVIAATKDA